MTPTSLAKESRASPSRALVAADQPGAQACVLDLVRRGHRGRRVAAVQVGGESGVVPRELCRQALLLGQRALEGGASFFSAT